MQHLFIFVLLISSFFNAIAQPITELKTIGANSPAIFASSVSIAYGIHPTIVLELDSLFAEEGLTQIQRRENAVALVAKFSNIEGDPKTGIIAESDIRQAFGKDAQPHVIQLFTEAANSPTIVAKGNVNVSYGISEIAFWKIYNLLEKQQISIEKWEETFEKVFKEFKELDKLLAERDDEQAILARKILNEGDIEGAKNVLKERLFFSRKLKEYAAKKNAEAAFDYGNILVLQLKYDSAQIIFEESIRLNPQNAKYILSYADNLQTLAKYDESVKYYLISISLLNEDTLNKDYKTNLSICYTNLGNSYYSKAEYEKSIECYNKSLLIDKIVYGEKDSKVATSYNNIGNVLQAKSEYEKAILFYLKAIEIDTIFFRERNSINVSRDYNNLGSVYVRINNLEKAEFFFKKALENDFKIYPDSIHPFIGFRYNNLGSLYDYLNKDNNALESFSKALKIYVKVFGEDHPYNAVVYNNMGEVYRKIQDYNKALNYYNQALKINLLFYGENHPETSMIYSNIGITYLAIKEFSEAETNILKALNIDIRIQKDSNINVALGYANLGTLFDETKKYDQAIVNYNKAIDIMQKILPPAHPYNISLRKNLAVTTNKKAQIFYDKKKYKKSLVEFKQGLEISRNLEDSTFLVTCIKYVSVVLTKLKIYDSALVYIDEGILITKQLDRDIYAIIDSLPESIRSNPVEFNNWKKQNMHTDLLNTMLICKVECLRKKNRKKEAGVILKELKLEVVRNQDKELLKMIRKGVH